MSGACQKIDLSSWPRRDIFSFFSALDQPFYSVCFRVDVTQLHAYTKSRGLSFYYAMTYLVTHAPNRNQAPLFSPFISGKAEKICILIPLSRRGDFLYLLLYKESAPSPLENCPHLCYD